MKTLAQTVANGVNNTGRPSNLIVEALAGTGKTTTLIEALNLLFGKQPRIEPSSQQAAIWEEVKKSKGIAPRQACFVAFNKSIATELQRRVPEGVAAMTLHSLGFKAVTTAFGRLKLDTDHVYNVIAELLEEDIRKLRREEFEFLRATATLVGYVKKSLVEDVNDNTLDELTSYYDLELNGMRRRVYDLVPAVVARCKTPDVDRTIDFDDQIWLPVVLDLPVIQYELLMVDEAQDLNRCQQALARKSGRRLVFCGDRNQAIYGFAGADSESLARLEHELTDSPQGCTVLPLTVTRRCGKAIVREAQAIVPEFEAHSDNPVGSIQRAAFKADAEKRLDSYHQLVEDGNMCVCRVNAPLVSQCLYFLRQGRKAEIQGREIGAGLISLVKKMKADTIVELIGRLDGWLDLETKKEQAKRSPSEARLINLQDRYDCIVCFSDGCTTSQEVIEKIERVFRDGDTPGIKFSSIHKAKGLEADRVFLLEPDKATVPHPMARTDWQRGQEMNLRYVAITRAIEELVYVG